MLRDTSIVFFILSGIVFVLMSLCITGVIDQFYQGVPNEASNFMENLEEKGELEREPSKMMKVIEEITETIWKRFSWDPGIRQKDNMDRTKETYLLKENIKTRKNDKGRAQTPRHRHRRRRRRRRKDRSNKIHVDKIYCLQEDTKTRENDKGRAQIKEQLQKGYIVVLGLLLSGITYLLLSMGNLFNLGLFQW